MGEFSCNEVVCPVILAGQGIGPKELFKFLVETFSLPVRLGVIGGREGLGDAKDVAELRGEGSGELGPPVGDQLLGKSEALPDMVSI